MEGEADAIECVLFTKEAIQRAIDPLGACDSVPQPWVTSCVDDDRELAEAYRDRAPVVLATLKGACLFFADLVRAMQPCPKGLEIDFLTVQSYGSDQVSSGTISIDNWCTTDLTSRHIILVDDICDTGRTLKFVMDALRPKCASIASVVLLDKTARRVVDTAPDYACFACPDTFVVGYGMDFQRRYRALPFIGVLKPSVVDANRETRR